MQQLVSFWNLNEVASCCHSSLIVQLSSLEKKVTEREFEIPLNDLVL